MEVEGKREPGSCAGRRCSLRADGQPSPRTVVEDRTSPVGALPGMGNGERDLRVGTMSACLDSAILPSTSVFPFLCQCNSSPFHPEPLKSQRLISVSRGSPCKLRGGSSFEREQTAFAHRSLGSQGGGGVSTAQGCWLTHLSSPASTAAPHPPVFHPMHCSPLASLGFGRTAEASSPDAGQESRGTGQICLSAFSYIASLTWPWRFITLF